MSLLPSWLDLSLSCIAYWALAMVSTVIGRWRGVVLVDFDVPVESVNAVRYKLKISTHPRETLDRSLSLESQIPRGNLPLGPYQ
ncbi:hypothetical protein [uncultured Nostoc sp.]|uniref:hypothetical protein n=1 Tax=uncultured Nostoc sp. TaxID=340711 RepID=UPI0035CA868F